MLLQPLGAGWSCYGWLEVVGEIEGALSNSVSTYLQCRANCRTGWRLCISGLLLLTSYLRTCHFGIITIQSCATMKKALVFHLREGLKLTAQIQFRWGEFEARTLLLFFSLARRGWSGCCIFVKCPGLSMSRPNGGSNTANTWSVFREDVTGWWLSTRRAERAPYDERADV